MEGREGGREEGSDGEREGTRAKPGNQLVHYKNPHTEITFFFFVLSSSPRIVTCSLRCPRSAKQSSCLPYIHPFTVRLASLFFSFIPHLALFWIRVTLPPSSRVCAIPSVPLVFSRAVAILAIGLLQYLQ